MLKHEFTESPVAVTALGTPAIQPIPKILPVVFLVLGLLTDLAYWRTGALWWAQGALWMACGLAASVALIAFFRLTDFLTLRRARARAGGWNMLLLNLLVLGLALANFLLRVAAPAWALPWGAGASLLTLAVYA